MDYDFFIQFDEATLELKTVSTKSTADDEHTKIIPIDKSLGLKFMEGTENIHQFCVVELRDGNFELHRKENVEQVVTSRLDVVQTFYTVEAGSASSITFVINEEENFVDVHYDGNQIKRLSGPVKFYFTGFDDPAVLKAVLFLDVNILTSIQTEYELDEWPNPLRMKIGNASDLSIHGIKGQLPASIKYDKVRSQ